MDGPSIRLADLSAAHPTPDLRGGTLTHLSRQTTLTVMLTGLLSSAGGWAASHFGGVTQDQLNAAMAGLKDEFAKKIDGLSMAAAKDLDDARLRGFAQGVASMAEATKKGKDDRGRRGRRHRNTVPDESDGDDDR